MPASVAKLRALGTRRVAFVTPEGTFSGTVDQARLGDDAIMVLLEPEGGAGAPVVIAFDAIAEIVER